MKIFEIRAVLDRLRLVYASSGAKSQAVDCEKLSQGLGEYDNELVETFVERVQDAFRQKDKKDARRTTTESADVGKYAPMLLAAGTNESAFNAIFSSIESDRKVTKPILEAIANQYLNELSGGNHLYKFKTKGHAIDAIRKKFIERAQAESKDKIIDQLMGRS